MAGSAPAEIYRPATLPGPPDPGELLSEPQGVELHLELARSLLILYPLSLVIDPRRRRIVGPRAWFSRDRGRGS